MLRAFWRYGLIHLSTIFTYRLNFFLSRFRGIVLFFLTYYVWVEASKQGVFSSYTSQEIFTYICIAHILRSAILDLHMHSIAQEINEGSFSKYLIQPLSHIGFWYTRISVDRLIGTASAILEVLLFVYILDIPLFVQHDYTILAVLFFFLFFSQWLSFLFAYSIGLIAFWSREAHGPRFLYDWIVQFSSGAFFPLSILQPTIFRIVAFLPFSSFVFIPAQIYLEQILFSHIVYSFALVLLWIIFGSVGVYILWKRGLTRYTGDGI